MSLLKILVLRLTLLNLIIKISSHELSLSKNLDLHSGLQPVSFTIFETTVELVMCKIPKDGQNICYLTRVENPNISHVSQCTLPADTFLSSKVPPRVFTFGKNESIVAWSTKKKGSRSIVLKFSIIQWPDCAKSFHQILLPDNDLSPKVVLDHLLVLPRKNSYEIIYENRLVCKTACSETLSNKGKKIAGAVDLNARSQKLGDFIFNLKPRHDFHAFRCFVLVNEEHPDISIFSTKEMSRKLNLETSRSTRFSVSTANEILGFCKQESLQSKFLNCSQGDLKKWFNLTFDYVPQDFVIHNLPGGGFLTVTIRKSVSVGKNPLRFVLTTFNAQNKQMYSVELTKADCGMKPQDVYVHMYESDGGNENCVAVFIPVKPFNLYVDCHSKKLLTGTSSWREVTNYPSYDFKNEINMNMDNISTYLIHDP